MSDLVGNLEDQFFQIAARFVSEIVTSMNCQPSVKAPRCRCITQKYSGQKRLKVRSHGKP